MGEAMKYLAPIANALGWKLEESSAAMMTVADAGIKGSMGGQAFATSLARLAKPTKPMAKAMDKLGMSFFDAQGDMKSLPQVVGEVEKATKKMTQEQRSSLLTTLFGAQAYKHWAVLLEKGSGELQRVTTELENADGAASRMATTMMDNLGGDWNLLIAGAMEAAYVIYEKFQPALRGVTQALTTFIGKVPAAIDKLIEFSKPFVPLAKAIGIAVLAVGSFFAMVGTFKLIGAALMFLINPVGFAIAAITGIVLAFQHFYKTSEPFRKGVEGIVGAFKGLFAILSDNNQKGSDIMRAAGLDITQIRGIHNFGKTVKTAFGKVKAVFGSVAKIFGGEHKGAIDVLEGAGFSEKQVDAIRAFGYGLKGAFDRIKTVFDGIGTLMSGGGSSDLLAALGFSPAAIASIQTFVEMVKTKVGEFVTFLAAKWEAIKPGIITLLTAFASLKDTAISIFTTLWGVLSPIFGAVMNALRIVADVAVMAFTNIIVPAVKFAISYFQMLWKIVGPILSLLGSAIGVAFEILRIAWETILKPVANFLTTIFKAAFEGLEPVIKNIGGMFEFFGGIIEKIAGWFDTFTSALSKFKVPSWLSKLGGGGTVKFESNETTSGGKSNYHGIDYVPYDGYQARLHRGESVVTAQENRESKSGGGLGGGVSITGNTFNVRQESDIDAVAESLLQKLLAAEGGGGY